MKADDQSPAIQSDALKANLQETAHEVEIDPKYNPLQEIVQNYQGLSTKLEGLLYEVSHPFRNWKMILPELRAYVLKNIPHFVKHEQGPHAFTLFSSIFFEALHDSTKNEQLVTRIIEAMLAYADKLVKSLSPEGLVSYHDELNAFFRKLSGLNDSMPSVMMLIVQGHHPVRRLVKQVVELYMQLPEKDFDLLAVAELMQLILQRNYEYWLGEEDPLPWFEEECGEYCKNWHAGDNLVAISHAAIRAQQERVNGVDMDKDPLNGLEIILALPNHMDIVRLYRAIPTQLIGDKDNVDEMRFLENRKLLFLFRIMDTGGLYLIHEETLREINRSLVHLIRSQSFEDIEQFFITTFHLLKANVRRYPHTSLQCIQVIGNEVFKRGNSRLVEAFLWEAVRFGFQYANFRGVDEDWQPIANPAHLSNIRIWLNLIQQEPKWCSTLFSALIINIRLTGICVKDTDLFQRDVTALLNHPIEPIYNLAKQFTKLMPVFFNEIGAEGELRDVSTDIDEIHKRKDVLIHFLRKQAHVESSNLIVGFIEAIFTFWITLEKEYLRDYLPEEVLKQVTTSGPFVDDQHTLAQRIKAELHFTRMDQILKWDEGERRKFLERQHDLDEKELERFDLLVKMYKLLHQKYNLSLPELRMQLQHAMYNGFPELEKLLHVLDKDDPFRCLEALLKQLEHMRDVILSEERFEPKEEIYYKRHIAVDIPSVYGRYSERKFDALGLTFRLESLANIYLERLFETVNLSFITQATFIHILRCLRLFSRALQIDGIISRKLETYVSLLGSSIGIKRFSYTQHLDIIRGFSESVKDIIYAYYTNIHQNNLSIIIPQVGKDNLLSKYQCLFDEKNIPESVLRISESFFRELISTAFGLQHMDNFISKIIQTLEAQKDLLDEQTLDLLMTYNPEKAISALHDENMRTHNLIHLGNKGFNLVILAKDEKPVPPAFIITSEIFRCYEAVRKFDRARDEFMQQVRASITEIEQLTDTVFGSPHKPLLLSVRSGSAISMPGMMTTIHNVGTNQELVEEFVAEHPDKKYFVWDNFRRFLQSWGMSHGMDREDFQELMNEHKQKHQIHLKREFTPEAMRELALLYQRAVRNRGYGMPEDPWLQLIGAVEIVLDSWNTHKAQEYRHLMDVSDDWGTAVIVQAMVYGNLTQEAGSGVLFTAHPYRKVRRVALWGDYAPGDQGEDIVSGLVTSYPVSVEQSELDGRDAANSLELKFPKIYARLLEISRNLVYDKGWNPQEIEFTFEGPEPEDLYILQTRDMITIKKKEHLNVFLDSDQAHRHILTKGIGVSGSALSGKAVFTVKNIRLLREKEPESVLILLRQDTVPEDIREISMADGLITSRGGQTSHASVVATRLEKTCVVGCRDLQVYETEEYAEVHGKRINFGDPISIDGRQGLLIEGNYPLQEEIHILPL